MTRSQAEGKGDDEEDKTAEGEHKGKVIERNEKLDIGKIGKKDVAQESPRLSRPVRLVRQKVHRKKVLVKKVVRVTREGKCPIPVTISYLSSCHS